MNGRVVVGIGILLAVLFILPVPALPDVRMFSPAAPAGNVWVTLNNINGTGSPEEVYLSYTMGTVSAIPAYDVVENQSTGFTTVTVMGATQVRDVTLSSANAAGSAYAVDVIMVSGVSEPLPVNSMNFGVMPSVANYYSDIVPAGKQHEWIDLDWKDTNKNLNLTVYAPDSTFGPYSDVSDGKKDGRIFLDVSSLLNVTPGHWFFKVQDMQREYTPFTLNTYSA